MALPNPHAGRRDDRVCSILDVQSFVIAGDKGQKFGVGAKSVIRVNLGRHRYTTDKVKSIVRKSGTRKNDMHRYEDGIIETAFMDACYEVLRAPPPPLCPTVPPTPQFHLLPRPLWPSRRLSSAAHLGAPRARWSGTSRLRATSARTRRTRAQRTRSQRMRRAETRRPARRRARRLPSKCTYTVPPAPARARPRTPRPRPLGRRCRSPGATLRSVKRLAP
jgi:hypothetical protein